MFYIIILEHEYLTETDEKGIKTFGSYFPHLPHLGRLEGQLSLTKAGKAKLLFRFYLSPFLSSSPSPKLKSGPAGFEEVGC